MAKNDEERKIRLPESYLAQQRQKAGDAVPVQPPVRKRKKHPLLRRVLLLILCILLLMAVCTGGYLAWSTRSDFLWLDLEQLPFRGETILYAQDAFSGDWTEYTHLSATQDKIWVPLEEIPLDMQHAFVAVEDQHFYEHHGISVTRTVYAALNEAKKILTGSYFNGGIKQGASTIDQQLIKNLTYDDETGGIEGYMRKVRELWRALVMDAKYDKDTIMEAYLNVISFTGNTAGVEAESLKLFGKHASELPLEQCASIASITKNPARYNPVTHPETHLERRNYILYEMAQQGYISEAEYEEAAARPLGLSPGEVPERETPVTSYFTDQVLADLSQELSRKYHLDKSETTNLIYNGGLRVYTTVDPELQGIMEKTLEKQYSSYFPTWGFGVPTKATVYNKDGTIARDEAGNPIREDVVEMPQAAMVSIGYDGALRAVVGGIGEKEVSRGLNRGMVPRQVGSTMKPIGAYALALEKNQISWSSRILDAPVRDVPDDKTGELKPWPANFSKTYSEQEILVKDALAQSINTAAVRVGEKAGVNAIYRFMKKDLGITSLTPEDRDSGPMILGSQTHGISPYELAGAYMMFGNGGKHTTLHSYIGVLTGSGREILIPEIETKQVIGSDTAYVMNRLLGEVMHGNGTAAGYSVRGEMESIGKTGTSSENRDFWFVGLTPYYVTATWYGYDSGFPLNTPAGTHAPTLAWRAVMEQVQRGKPTLEFPADESVVTTKYCTESGCLAVPGCPHTAQGWYAPDALPPLCRDHAA